MKATTISGAVLGLGIMFIYGIGETVLKSEGFLQLSAVVFIVTAICIGFTWGFVEFYKRMKFAHFIRQAINKPFSGKGKDTYATERDKVYTTAVMVGAGSTLLSGSIFLLADDLTKVQYIVVSVVWLIYSGAVGLLIPVLWRFVFVKLLAKSEKPE